MIKVGDIVKVLEPFTVAYPDTYEITEVKDNGVCTFVLEDTNRDFDSMYLEKV